MSFGFCGLAILLFLYFLGSFPTNLTAR